MNATIVVIKRLILRSISQAKAYRCYVLQSLNSYQGPLLRSGPSDLIPQTLFQRHAPQRTRMLPTSYKQLSSKTSASCRYVVPNHPRAKEYIAIFPEQRTRRPLESSLRRERIVWPESTKPLDEDVGHWLLRKKVGFFAF